MPIVDKQKRELKRAIVWLKPDINQASLCYPVVYPQTQPRPGLNLSVVQMLFEGKIENERSFNSLQMFSLIAVKLI